jgi:methylthioribose-1-phosphate isomerase
VEEIVPLRLSRPHGIELLDQSLLPREERYLTISTVAALSEAIRSLRVRGAPLLGVAGAAGMAIAAERTTATDADLREAAGTIVATRPTAVDLGARAQQALAIALGIEGAPARREALWEYVEALQRERVAEDRAMGDFGAGLLAGGAVLTHCNAGALATGGIGTALGVVRTAWERGLLRECFATETRPLLQGARLTMWELTRLGIPSTLLPDTAAASLIASGKVTAVMTGADRIAANGDTANKVGTYGLAAVAARHSVPFYVAAPVSTFDLESADGVGIPIEFRAESEVGGFGDERWSPAGARGYNPAFDVTPAELIAAIVCERGVAWPPFRESLAALAFKP